MRDIEEGDIVRVIRNTPTLKEGDIFRVGGRSPHGTLLVFYMNGDRKGTYSRYKFELYRMTNEERIAKRMEELRMSKRMEELCLDI